MADDFAAIQRFWARTLPAIGGPPLRRLPEPLGYRPSELRSLPVCNGVRLTASVAADNAFYCRQENVVVYDEGLVPDLGEQFGRRAVGVLLAHEYGHAIQTQLGDYDTSIRLELQADCFAGAWAASTTTGGDGADTGVVRAFLASVQDATDDEQTAHGSGFDRVSAYALGARHGARRCLDRSALPPSDRARPVRETTEDGRSVNPTRDLASLLAHLEVAVRRGSGTPAVEVVLLSTAADMLSCNGSRVATSDLAGRAVACPRERVLVVDDAQLGDLWARDGDLAAGYVLVRGYLQTQLAADVGGDPAAAERAALDRVVECRTGASLADLVRAHDPALRMYTADLDEVIAGAADVTPTSPGLTGDSTLTLVERIDQLRRGYDAGASACVR